jgi:hypothetical protein
VHQSNKGGDGSRNGDDRKDHVAHMAPAAAAHRLFVGLFEGERLKHKLR